ncbi:hypothetical protein [Thalassococcus sp. S3]|uniref:hypothetical protein n=1 Tax=Thalassococcus sp. S3 TaxID=2017482 RepID=UPI001024686F|nr:hypothetical protein [Thalassococcus sp. S3]QBF29883.1 hypothetical protein CFI11_01440 [Thalassococcus sp. S3]
MTGTVLTCDPNPQIAIVELAAQRVAFAAAIIDMVFGERETGDTLAPTIIALSQQRLTRGAGQPVPLQQRRPGRDHTSPRAAPIAGSTGPVSALRREALGDGRTSQRIAPFAGRDLHEGQLRHLFWCWVRL